MKYKPLGRTGLDVSEICLGTMTWGRQNTEAEGHAQIDYALDQGVNFIDCAEMYPIPPTEERYGGTEKIIGTWMAQNTSRRDDFVLATKIAGGGSHRSFLRDGKPPSRQTVTEAVDNSLARLQTDHIDLYQIHWPWRSHYHFGNGWTYDYSRNDAQEVRDFIGELLRGFDDVQKAGKVRHFGVSNESSWGVMQYLKTAVAEDLPRLASIQNEYSLVRRLFELELAEVSLNEDVSLLAYSSLAAGILSGKYLDGAMPEGSRQTLTGKTQRHSDATMEATREYLALAKKHGLDACQMALAFCLSRPFMTSVIIGATTMDQLRTDIGAADVTLSDEVLAGIEDIYHRYPRPY